MSSTYTTAVLLELQGTGDNDGTWGTVLNAVLQDIDDAIAGINSKSVAGSSDVTLTDAEARYAFQTFTGTLTGDISVIVPARTKLYYVHNSTSGAYTVTVKTSAGTGILVPQGSKLLLKCDGTNVIAAMTAFPRVGYTPSTLTLSSGAATGALSGHTIAAESGTSDTLDTLTATAYQAGDVVRLKADSGDTIYVSTDGNFNQPCLLDDSTYVEFTWTGSAWELNGHGWVLLDKQVASGSSSLDFSKGIGSAYDHYMFKLKNIVPASDGADFYMRTSTDGGSNFAVGSGSYAYAVLSMNADAAFDELKSTSSVAMLLAKVLGTGTGEFLAGTVEMHEPANANAYTQVDWRLGLYDSSPAWVTVVGGAARLAAQDEDAVRFVMSTGNIATGTIELYGLKH